MKGGITTEGNTTILLSRYPVKEILKSGRDTNVYLVEHPTIKQQLLIIKQLRISPSSTERFNRELNILKTLKHSSIPRLYDIHKDEDYYYIIEEYIKGESLKSIVQKKELSVNTAIRYILRLCDILKYLHEHSQGPILYLDCRPENIIISSDDACDNLYLIDFGNSQKLFDSRPQAAPQFLYGSIGYAAPELYAPSSHLSERTDVYGVGALLYYMLTGGLAPTNNIDFHKRKIPKKLLHIIRKCLRHQPILRYSGVNELIRAFNQFNFPKTILKNNKNTSLTISIAGSDRRVGTTHLGMSLAWYFSHHNRYCILKEKNSHNIFHRLLKNSSEAAFLERQNGFFSYKGVLLAPEHYNGSHDSFGKVPEVIINDFGILTKDNSNEYSSADICLLIGSGRTWELNDLLDKEILCIPQKTILIINFISGTDFYRLCSSRCHTNGRSFIRMPYYNDWHKLTTQDAGKRFLTELLDKMNSLYNF